MLETLCFRRQWTTGSKRKSGKIRSGWWYWRYRSYWSTWPDRFSRTCRFSGPSRPDWTARFTWVKRPSRNHRRHRIYRATGIRWTTRSTGPARRQWWAWTSRWSRSSWCNWSRRPSRKSRRTWFCWTKWSCWLVVLFYACQTYIYICTSYLFGIFFTHISLCTLGLVESMVSINTVTVLQAWLVVLG